MHSSQASTPMDQDQPRPSTRMAGLGPMAINWQGWGAANRTPELRPSLPPGYYSTPYFLSGSTPSLPSGPGNVALSWATTANAPILAPVDKAQFAALMQSVQPPPWQIFPTHPPPPPPPPPPAVVQESVVAIAPGVVAKAEPIQEDWVSAPGREHEDYIEIIREVRRRPSEEELEILVCGPDGLPLSPQPPKVARMMEMARDREESLPPYSPLSEDEILDEEPIPPVPLSNEEASTSEMGHPQLTLEKVKPKLEKVKKERPVPDEYIEEQDDGLSSAELAQPEIAAAPAQPEVAEQVAQPSQPGGASGASRSSPPLGFPPKNGRKVKIYYAIDWADRQWQIDIEDFSQADQPSSWFIRTTPVKDSLAEEVQELALLLKNEPLHAKELERLREAYGVFLATAVHNEMARDLEERREVLDIRQHSEIQARSSPADCTGCGVLHPQDSAMCKEGIKNDPLLLANVVTGHWRRNKKAVLVGLLALRRQPQEVMAWMANLSLNGDEDGSCAEDIGIICEEEKIKGQPLYKMLRRRLAMMSSEPDLVLYVEYAPPFKSGGRPGAVRTLWGPLQAIRILQREFRNPIVLVVPPCRYWPRMAEAAFEESKVNWMESVRTLALMARSLGVPLLPLIITIYPTMETEQQARLPTHTMGNRPEFLYKSADGRRGREYYRRIAIALEKAQAALEAVKLSKECWAKAAQLAK